MKNLGNSVVTQGVASESARQAPSERSKFDSVTLIYVPMYYGGPHRGAGLGPHAMRAAGLAEHLQQMGYRVAAQLEIPVPESVCWQQVRGVEPVCLPEIATASMSIAAAVEQAMDNKTIPITIGGDHSIAIGSIAGASAFYRKHKQKFGIIWFDAHGDINLPETTPSGRVHGMPLAVALGEGDKRLTDINGYSPKATADKAVLVGIRDLDHGERNTIARTGVTAFSMHEVDRMGMGEVTDQALEIAGRDSDGVHLSFDIDVMDPEVAPGVSTPSRGGLTYREVSLALELMAASGKLRSIDIAELNPMRDVQGKTSELAVQIVLTALGSRILY